MDAAPRLAHHSELQQPVAAGPRAFHGWHVVGVMFAAQAITVGATSYAFSLFLEPIGREFGVEPSLLVFGMGAMLLFVMAVGPFLGFALDRRSIRALVIAGVFTFAAGLALMAASSSLTLIALLFCVVGAAGNLLAGPMAANKLVANWFIRMRGRALGIASVGTSVGGAALPQVSAWSIEAVGWRGALLVIAALAVVAIVPAALRWIANRPEDRGQMPDGDLAAPPPDLVEQSAVPLLALVGDRNFWGISLAFGLAWGVVGSLLSFFNLYAGERGIDLRGAASVLSAISISAVAGKLAFGAAAERIDRRWLVLLGIALQLGFIALLRSHPRYGLLVGAGIVFGISLGGLLPMHGALVADYYGRRSFAAVMGAMGPVLTPLLIAAIALGAWLPRLTGGYDRVLEVFVAAELLALGALALLRPMRSA
jgi:MFS family permease